MGNPLMASENPPVGIGGAARTKVVLDTADRMSGGGGASKNTSSTDGGVKGDTMTPTAKAPANIHPSAKGVYGTPIQAPIVGSGS